MNNNKSRIIYYLLGLLVILVGAVWAITWNTTASKVSAVDAELQTHETAQHATDLENAKHWTNIDDRLARIEAALHIDTGTKK